MGRCDRGDCDRAFGAANVFDVDTVRIDTGTVGMVDFGDDLHLWGAPQGDAVVCWQRNGRVLVKGRVFADTGDTNIYVYAHIQYINNGVVAATSTHKLSGGEGSKFVNVLTAAGNLTQVRIRLFTGQTIAIAPRPPDTLVHTSNRFRG